jgi:hypothetical protein
MNSTKRVNQAVIGFVLIFLMSGCANYGKLSTHRHKYDDVLKLHF